MTDGIYLTFGFPSPSGISVLQIIKVIGRKRFLNIVSVPFGDIGSSNLENLSTRYQKSVSVPFGDIGSSNHMSIHWLNVSKMFPSPSGISVLQILSSAMQHSCGGKCSFAAQKLTFLLSKILYRDFGWEGRSSHPADCTLKDTKISKVSGASSRSLTPIPLAAPGLRRGFRS